MISNDWKINIYKYKLFQKAGGRLAISLYVFLHTARCVLNFSRLAMYICSKTSLCVWLIIKQPA